MSLIKKYITSAERLVAKALYSYVGSVEQLEKLAGNRVVCIIARDLYKEWTRQYPLPQAKDVKKAVALERDAYDGYVISKQPQGGFLVTFWSFLPAVKNNENRILLPESLVFSRGMDSRQCLSITTKTSQLFVATRNGAIFSARKTKLVSNAQTFLKASGIEDKQVIELDWDAAHERIAKNVPRTIRYWKRFWQTKPGTVSLYRLGSYALLIVFLYLAGSAALIKQSAEKVSSTFSANQEELQSVMALQESVSEKQRKLSEFSVITSQSKPTERIWQILKPLYEMDDVSLRRVTYRDDGFFEVFGEADKATDVLRLLIEKYGLDVSFNRPVSTRRGRDTFSMEIAPDWTTTELSAEQNDAE